MHYIYMLPAAFLAPVIHELVKALCSAAQGDPTPKNSGRLSLNPFKHFDPIGFLFIMAFGFGWGNPAPTAALHYKNRQRGVVITYLTPVLVSLLLGIGAAAGVALISNNIFGPLINYNQFMGFTAYNYFETDIRLVAMLVLSHFAFINICMALFNLIPIYPLAANKILLLFSRPDNIARINHYEKPMQIILVLLLAFGIMAWIFWPIALQIVRLVWGVVV